VVYTGRGEAGRVVYTGISCSAAVVGAMVV